LDKPLFEGNLFGGEGEKDSPPKIVEIDDKSKTDAREKSSNGSLETKRATSPKSRESGNKFAISFISGGLFLFIIGVIILAKSLVEKI
jgi:hypothetical protein